MRLGADADAVERVATTLAASAAAVRRARRVLDASSRSVAWHGPDARRFDEEWRAAAGSWGRLASALDAAAGAASAQAEAQRRTSAAATLPEALPTTLPATRSTRGPGVVPEAAPRRIRVAALELDLGMAGAAAVGAGERWRLEDLADGQVRVSELSSVSGGVQVGNGATATAAFGGRRWEAGSGAQAQAMVGVGLGPSWTVARDRVDDVLVGRAAELAGDVASVLVAGPMGPALAWLAGPQLPGVPTPDRDWVVAEAAARATGAATAGPGRGRTTADAGLDVTVAVSSDHRTGATQVAIGGSVVAAAIAPADASGAPGGWSGSVGSVGLDVSASAVLTSSARGRPLRLDLEATRLDGETLIRHRSSIDLTAPAVRRSAAALVDAVERLPTDGIDDVRAALRDLTTAGADTARSVVDRYRAVAPSSVEVSLPVGSLVVRAEEYRLVTDR